MTKRQAFKIGFYKKFAELGVDPDEAQGIVEKQAANILGPAFGLSKVMLAAMLGLPIAVGGLTGGLYAAATSPSEEDVDDIRKQELEAAYNRARKEVERRVERKRGLV